jgi:hypothetical protein
MLRIFAFIFTILFTLMLVSFFRQTDVNAPLKIRLLGAGWNIRNFFRNKLRSGLQIALLWAGIGIISSVSAVHNAKAQGISIDHGVVSRRVVTTAGVNAIRDQFLATFTLANFKYHASGTGTTAEAVGDTALVTEVESRVAGTQVSGGTGAYQTVATIPYTATRAITEHGIFSASSVGTLLDRSVFTAINVVNGDSITFTYTITFSAGG